MKVFIARTSEVDDKEAALKFISDQIAAEGSLEKNTVGMLCCHYEFVLSGVAEYIAKNLPFPVVGTSTTLVGYNGAGNEDDEYNEGQFRLSITVISSDDISFTTVISEPLTPETKADEVCKKQFEEIGKQKLGIMMFPNIILTDFQALLDCATTYTKAQIFGGSAVDDSPTYIENCFVFAKGVAYRDRAVFLFMNGNINPHFSTIVVTKDKYLKGKAIITEARGNEIISLNGRPVTDFLSSLGFNLTGSKENAINSAVMIVDDGDGDEYGRSMMYLTPENHLFVGGNVTTGATVSVAMFEKKAVLDASAASTAEMLAAHPDAKVAFISSCETRHVLLGSNTFDGENMLRNQLGGLPFSLAYAGGEVCPSNASTPENPINRIFNQSYCICMV
ncbi:MAG: hypothetical protein LBM41_07090 [Ruminococcus sp.]|nr:hypothetical protein [Ruminococcus sp.]